MAIRELNCPNCGNGLTITKESIGEEIGCPYCGNTFGVFLEDDLEDNQDLSDSQLITSYYQAPPKLSAMAVASLILGIIGLLLFFLAPIFALPALILGVISNRAIKHSDDSLCGAKLAISGIILAIIQSIFFSIFLVIAIPKIAQHQDDIKATKQCQRNIQDINIAKTMWRIDAKPSDDYQVMERDLVKYLKDEKMLYCPLHGKYKLGTPISKVRCSAKEHH